MTTPKAGVYALVHRATGRIYIGSSLNLKERRKSWWARMNQDRQNLPPSIRDLTAAREDWDFVVLWDGTGQPSALLQLRENEAVAHLRQRDPARCLNTLPVQRADNAGFTAGGRTMSFNAWSRETGIARATIAMRAQQLGWTPEQAVGIDPPPVRDHTAEHFDHSISVARVVVYDGDTPMTRRRAAERLGCKLDTLTRRLLKYQIPDGQARVQLRDLQALSDRWRVRRNTA
jgi:hypothetical protein